MEERMKWHCSIKVEGFLFFVFKEMKNLNIKVMSGRTQIFVEGN